jgi:hypothetical protein
MHTIPNLPLSGNLRGAAELSRRGLSLARLDRATKRPVDPDWPDPARRSPVRPGDDYGIITGPQSNYNRPGHALVTADLDSRAAVELAPRHLPATAMMDGRPGKRRSHWFYLIDFDSIPAWALATASRSAEVARQLYGHRGPFSKSFRDANGRELFRLCGTGAQVVAPPSLWRSADGTRTERRGWEGGRPGEPAVVEFLALWHALCDLADAVGAKVPAVDRPTHTAARASALPATDAVLNRAVAYVGKMDGAVSGQNGHTQTFKVARALAWGFGLDAETAFQVLRDVYNPRCTPPWPERDLRHKAEDAARLGGTPARGHLRDTPPPARAARPAHSRGRRVLRFRMSGGAR